MYLPEYVKKTRACVSVKSNDEHSFKWAVLSALYPQHNGQRIHPYKKFERELDFSGMTFPFEQSQVARFEKQNDISIDIYILQNENISLAYKSLDRKPKHVDLLLIKTVKNFHYVWIKNLPWLLKSFEVSRKNFQEKNEVTQSENSSEIMDKFRNNILQKVIKLNLEDSKETPGQLFDFSSNFQHRKELDSEKKDVSTQTSSDIINREMVQKLKPKNFVKNCNQIVNISPRAKDSYVEEEKWNNSMEAIHDEFDQGSSPSHTYTTSIDDKSQTKDEIDYENWEDPNDLVDRLRLLIEQRSIGNYGEISIIIRELREAGYIY